jgi:peptidoglycan/LPS O-acetylase OafA/YrhL
MKKLEFIDALRGLAILGVIMVHTFAYGTPNPSGKIGIMFSSGANGVQLFFLASAFTLFLSFKNRSSIEEFPIRNFFVRRFFRIAPMYYLGICYYLLQDGYGPRFWLGDATHITPLNIISNFTFIHGFNPYWINSLVPGGWSIGIEMIFYGILPFLFSKIKNINQAFILFILSLFLRLFFYALLIKFPLISSTSLWNGFLFLYFPSQLPVFSLGIIFYFLVIENESVKNISSKWILLFSGLLILQLSTQTTHLLPTHVLFSIGFLLLGYSLSSFKFKLLVNPVITHIGKISFSMYLVHFAVLHWLDKFHLVNYSQNGIINYAARFSITIAITAAISTFFYNVIEIPFQKVAKNIISRWEKGKYAVEPVPNKEPEIK